MRKLDRSKLLQFLSEPRYADQVARYFNISKTCADYHLKRAIKSGHILVSQKPVFLPFPNLRGGSKQQYGLLHISRNSPLVAGGSSLPTVNQEEKSASSSALKLVSIKFVSGNASSEKTKSGQNLYAFSGTKEPTLRAFPDRTRAGDFRSANGTVSSFLNIHAAKGRLVKKHAPNQLFERRKSPVHCAYKLLNQVDKFRLLKSVSDKPSTFLDIHGRFGVSREVIESFVRHGLLKEIWGPEHIGVRFSLTAKGKRFLKELESAANFKPPRREKLIALKREILP